jgi:hypothetical protein
MRDRVRTKAGARKRVNPAASQAPVMSVDVEGVVRLHIDVRVPTTEIATWDPVRIETFFRGLSMVTAARTAGDLLRELRYDREVVNGLIFRLENAKAKKDSR